MNMRNKTQLLVRHAMQWNDATRWSSAGTRTWGQGGPGEI